MKSDKINFVLVLVAARIITKRIEYINRDNSLKKQKKKNIAKARRRRSGPPKLTPCLRCNKDTKNKKYCSKSCLVASRQKTTDKDLQTYRSACKFNFSLKDYPEEFNFSLIEKHGWYSPTNRGNNLAGVSRDHIYSVREGFENKVDPSILSHPANCQLMIHLDNISKNKNSQLTLEQLLIRIKKWEEKYGPYY